MVKQVSPEAAGSVAITFDIPADCQRKPSTFEPGQFLTLRADSRRPGRAPQLLHQQPAQPPGQAAASWKWASARSRAACSPTGRRPPSRPATRIKVMPPDGRFMVKKAARHPPRGLCRRLGHHAHPVDRRHHAGGATRFEVHPGVRQPPHGQRDVQRGAARPERPLRRPLHHDPHPVAPGAGSRPAARPHRRPQGARSSSTRCCRSRAWTRSSSAAPRP